MTRLLLDFPWPIESLLDRYSESFIILGSFEELCAEENLKRLSFVDPQTYDAFCLAAFAESRPDVVQFHMQIVPQYVRYGLGTARAEPVAGPEDLPDSWYCSLRDELNDPDWRTPQIIASKGRLELWRGSLTGAVDRAEVLIDADDLPRPVQRVFAVLDNYGDHKYARSDRDPWDLRRFYEPQPNAPTHQAHPCLLPRPPGLANLALSEIAAQLPSTRNWEIGGKYFFAPLQIWTPNQASPDEWRQGRGFPRKDCPHCGRANPVDFKDEVWCWDETHRHWDVQCVGQYYWSISHDGSLIDRKLKRR